MKRVLITGGLAGVLLLSGCTIFGLGTGETATPGYRIVSASESHPPTWIHNVKGWSGREGVQGGLWIPSKGKPEETLVASKSSAMAESHLLAGQIMSKTLFPILMKELSARKVPVTKRVSRRLSGFLTYGLEQLSDKWLMDGHEYAYFWMKEQPSGKKTSRVVKNVPEHSGRYVTWVLVRYGNLEWNCAKVGALRLLPDLVDYEKQDSFDYREFSMDKYKVIVQNVVRKQMEHLNPKSCEVLHNEGGVGSSPKI